MAFVVGFDCWVAFGVAPRARGAVPLVAVAALVTLVLVMAVATAGLTMFVGVGVVVVMAVAAARGLAVLCERAGDKGLDASVAAALGTCVYRDAGLGKREDFFTFGKTFCMFDVNRYIWIIFFQARFDCTGNTACNSVTTSGRRCIME